MVDFHTHILPGMDDGSKSLRQSLTMLRMEREMGIGTVVLTPHFYALQDTPQSFLERRSRALESLLPHLQDAAPRLLPGAEVQYFDHMDDAQQIPSLCIGGTGVLLLEMPFRPWDERIVRTVLELNSRDGLRVVLAHIERYGSFCPGRSTWQLLQDSGILMQVNCSFFSGFFGRRRAMRLMEQGRFQLIGSDCHSLNTRPPNWNLVPPRAAQSAGAFARALLEGDLQGASE